MSNLGLTLLLGLLATACIPPVYTRTGDRVLPARAPDCAFSLYTVSPPPAAVELGVIQFSGKHDVQSARAAAAPLVCAAGGNGLVLWTGEKDGDISTATVIATPGAPPAASRSGRSATARWAGAPGATAGGRSW